MSSGWIYNATPAVTAQSQYPTILGVCIALTTLMTIVIGLRAYVRVVLLKSVGADDWTILFSAICSIIYNALAVARQCPSTSFLSISLLTVLAESRWGLGLPVRLRPKVNTYDYRTVSAAWYADETYIR